MLIFALALQALSYLKRFELHKMPVCQKQVSLKKP